MAEPSTVARPYAEAAFEIAASEQQLGAWSTMLGALAQVAGDARVEQAIADPKRSAAQAAGVILSILSGKLSASAENFVRVLATNRRLGLLGEIRTQFERLKDEREGVIEAEIVSAFELDAAQRADLVARLEKRTGRKVRTRMRLDKELIGGVRVVIGDQVIDGSARAQLGALMNALRK